MYILTTSDKSVGIGKYRGMRFIPIMLDEGGVVLFRLQNIGQDFRPVKIKVAKFILEDDTEYAIYDKDIPDAS